ncbi:MFS transporter [Arsenicicoccus bolidensis]|uniref:MFS transporter n=1 Tax=Arsenicicoccus bolidensis TaxID=229480 RepID=UPI000413EFAB|nr:MFS transporter [Arsenicicoccus bolidensis]
MSAPARPHAFTRRQWLVLLVLLGAGFLLALDFSILNVALPEIGAGVGLSNADLPWIAAAYALPAAGFTLLFGRLADLLGRRRVFLGGMVLLICASALGGLATTPEVLLTARVLQGLAAAMSTPAALSLLTTEFDEGAARDRVLGFNGAILSGGFTVGALVGGALVSLISWRAAFLINLPVALAILVLTPGLVAASRVPHRPVLDVPGALTVTGGLLAGVYAIIEQDWRWGLAGILLLAAFVVVELRATAPLVPLRILRRPPVRWGNGAGMVTFSMETAAIFLMTIYVQQSIGLSPVITGLVFGIPGLAAVSAGILAGRFLGAFGTRRVLVTGMVVQGVATLPLAFVGTDRTALLLIVPALLVGFFGHVTAIVAYTVAGTSGLPDDQQGLATGLTSMTQQVAITVGIPILGSLAATQATSQSGLRLALVVDAAVVVVGAGLVWHGLRPRTLTTNGPSAPAQPADPYVHVSTEGLS